MDREDNVRDLTATRPLPVLGHYHLHPLVGVVNHFVGPLGVIDEVHVGEPYNLGGSWHVGLAGKTLPIYLQDVVLVVPVAHFFWFEVLLYLDVLHLGIGVQVNVEGVLTHHHVRPWEDGNLVIPRPVTGTSAWLAEVAGECQYKEVYPVFYVTVEVVIGTLTRMNHGWLYGGKVLGQLLYHLLGGAGYLLDGVRVVLGAEFFVELERGLYLYLLAVRSFDLEAPFQGGVNAHGGKVFAHVLAGNDLGTVALGVPDHKVSPILSHLGVYNLHLLAVTGEFLVLIAGNNVCCPQDLQIVQPHQQWQVGVLFYEVHLVQQYTDLPLLVRL